MEAMTRTAMRRYKVALLTTLMVKDKVWERKKEREGGGREERRSSARLFILTGRKLGRSQVTVPCAAAGRPFGKIYDRAQPCFPFCEIGTCCRKTCEVRKAMMS